MTDASFFTFLTRALHALANDVPIAHAALVTALGALRLRITVDDETQWLSVRAGRCELDACGPSDAELRTRRQTVVALLEARLTLLGAVTSDDLMLRGAPQCVCAMHDALLAFIQGAVRSAAIPPLLERYLAAAPCAGARAQSTGGDP